MPENKTIKISTFVLTIIGMAVAGISTVAVYGEKISQNEQKILGIQTNVTTTGLLNTSEHTEIIKKLSKIEGILEERK